MSPDVPELAVRRCTEVDRGTSSRRRTGPGGGQELLARRDQVVGPGPDPLGVQRQHMGLARQEVDQQLHVVDQGRGEGLHALGRDPVRELVGELVQLRVLLPQRSGPGTHLVGEQQLAARRRPHPVGLVERALVGDGEGTDLLDVVTPELNAQRVLLRRREDVDEPAPHGELAAPLHEVHPRVRGLGKSPSDILEVGAVPDPELDRLQVGQPLDLGLQHRAHRCDHDLEGPGVGRVPGMAETPQHRKSTAHRVTARREPLVRQRLPCRVVGDLVLREE